MTIIQKMWTTTRVGADGKWHVIKRSPKRPGTPAKPAKRPVAAKSRGRGGSLATLQARARALRMRDLQIRAKTGRRP